MANYFCTSHRCRWQTARHLGHGCPPRSALPHSSASTRTNFSAPGPQQEKTYERLAKLKRDGVRVDGLGNQAHFNSSFHPSSEELLRVTDRFTAVAPKQVITD